MITEVDNAFPHVSIVLSDPSGRPADQQMVIEGSDSDEGGEEYSGPSSGEVSHDISAAQETADNPKTAAARARVGAAFEKFRKNHAVSVGVFDGFLFSRQQQGCVASTLWTERSHLCTYIKRKYQQDFSESGSFKDLLKSLTKQHKPRQARVLTQPELISFLRDAPNEGNPLRFKIIALICYFGVARIADIDKLDWNEVVIRETDVIVTLHQAKSAVAVAEAEIIVPKMFDTIDVHALFVLYKDVQIEKTGQVWKQFQKGKWTRSVVGHNTLAKTPRKIAEFLKLPDPQLYTGHCLRRSAATAMGNNGATLNQLMHAGGWHSSTMARRYVETSAVELQQAANLLAASAGNAMGPVSAPAPALPPAPAPAPAPALAPVPPPAPAPGPASTPVNTFTFTNCSFTFN